MAPKNVVLDTDVYSALYTDPERAERRGLPVTTWLEALAGDRVLISFQTRAEVLAGLRAGNWGDSRRQTALAKLDAVPTIPADREVIDSYAELTSLCLRAGHALHAKVHTADRWVAACAVAKGLPLMSGDGIYQGAPGLSLLMEG
ncbi:PIN domain-containing protein [Nocardioides panacisoli]|uniref:PIN domain-containing protein n=1 Tax=Nocardioides panacisoli TaxID=627624 RepID=A0ABP7HVZ9_9ACTN